MTSCKWFVFVKKKVKKDFEYLRYFEAHVLGSQKKNRFLLDLLTIKRNFEMLPTM